jgi:hypothetical protein
VPVYEAKRSRAFRSISFHFVPIRSILRVCHGMNGMKPFPAATAGATA